MNKTHTLNQEAMEQLAKSVGMDLNKEPQKELKNDPLMQMVFEYGSKVILFNQPGDAVGWAIDYNGTAKLMSHETEISHRLPVVLENDYEIVYLNMTLDDSGHICKLVSYLKESKTIEVMNDFIWDKTLEPLPQDRMKLMVMIFAFCKNMIGEFGGKLFDRGTIHISEFGSTKPNFEICNLGFFGEVGSTPEPSGNRQLMATFNNSTVLKSSEFEQLKSTNYFYKLGEETYQHRDFVIEFTEDGILLHYLFSGRTWMTYKVQVPEMLPASELFQMVWILSMVCYKNTIYYNEAIANAFMNGPKVLNLVLMKGKEVDGRLMIKKVKEHDLK